MLERQKLFDKIWNIFYTSGNVENNLEDQESKEIIRRLYKITSRTEPDYNNLWGKIHNRIIVKHRKILLYKWVACVVLLASSSLFSVYFAFYGEKQQPLALVQESFHKGVTLTLPDGKVVGLKKQVAGDILKSDEIVVAQNKEAKDSIFSSLSTELRYNIMDVPVAAEYRLILPDGTKVYMNSSSWLKYPVAYANNERRVFLKGEAYFEVVSDKKRPFRVEVEGTVVEALGTAFNINAYSGKTNIQTTLVHGKVQVGNSCTQVVLEPGQQAICSEDQITVQAVNYRDFVAWKDGLFVFSRMTLGDIMMQMRRWYGLEVVFLNQEIRDYTFTGMIDRSLSPEETFRIIEKTVSVHFKIEDKTVIIN